MHGEMKSPSIEQLSKALVDAQKALKPAKKEVMNTFLKNHYADLASVWDACRDALQSNGLSVAQTTFVLPDGRMALRTMLLHLSGEWLAGDYLLAPQQPTPQGFGSAMTYARRYALAAIVGITQEDDDGHAGSTPASSKASVATTSTVPTKSPTPTIPSSTISEKQAVRLAMIAKTAGWEVTGIKAALNLKWDYKSSKDISKKDYEEICTYFTQAPETKEVQSNLEGYGPQSDGWEEL